MLCNRNVLWERLDHQGERLRHSGFETTSHNWVSLWQLSHRGSLSYLWVSHVSSGASQPSILPFSFLVEMLLRSSPSGRSLGSRCHQGIPDSWSSHWTQWLCELAQWGDWVPGCFPSFFHSLSSSQAPRHPEHTPKGKETSVILQNIFLFQEPKSHKISPVCDSTRLVCFLRARLGSKHFP